MFNRGGDRNERQAKFIKPYGLCTNTRVRAGTKCSIQVSHLANKCNLGLCISIFNLK